MEGKIIEPIFLKLLSLSSFKIHKVNPLNIKHKAVFTFIETTLGITLFNTEIFNSHPINTIIPKEDIAIARIFDIKRYCLFILLPFFIIKNINCVL